MAPKDRKGLEKALPKLRKIYKNTPFKKNMLLHVYHSMVESGEIEESMLKKLLIKRGVRSTSGVLVHSHISYIPLIILITRDWNTTLSLYLSLLAEL